MSNLKSVLPYSGYQWEAHKNSSWGESHTQQFGNRAGYVICYRNTNREVVALASVIGQPFILQTEIDANARLIEMSPDMARFIEKLAFSDETELNYSFRNEARSLYSRLTKS